MHQGPGRLTFEAFCVLILGCVDNNYFQLGTWRTRSRSKLCVALISQLRIEAALMSHTMQ